MVSLLVVLAAAAFLALLAGITRLRERKYVHHAPLATGLRTRRWHYVPPEEESRVD